MTRDDPLTDSGIIDLLVLWHRYESQWSPVQGYPAECPSTIGYRASRQYDDENGAFETDQRGKLAATVGAAVNSIPEPERTALYTLARNRATGVSVWSSARLPTEDQARARIVARALDLLAVLL